MDDILNLSMPSTSFSAFSRSRKDSPVVLPKSPVFTPVKTTSLTPWAAISCAIRTTSHTGTFLLRPLA